MLEEQPIFNNQTLDASSNQPFSNSSDPFQTDNKEFSSDQMMHSAGDTLIDIGENQGDYTAEDISDIGNIFDPVISSTKNTSTPLANHSNIDEILGTSFGINSNHEIADDLITNGRSSSYGSIINDVVQEVQASLQGFAASSDFTASMNTAFGTSWDTKTVSELQQSWSKGNFGDLPQIKISGDLDVVGANGAYAFKTDTIYLSQGFVERNAGNIDGIKSVLLEEIGHAVDSRINLVDAAGDEGDIFQTIVQKQSLNAIDLSIMKAENDYATVNIDSESLTIEMSKVEAIAFNNRLYQTMRDKHNGVYTRYSSDGNWTNWEVNGGTLDTPELEVFNNRLYQTVRGEDNGVYTRSTSDGNNWTIWERNGTSLDAAELEVFNNRLYQTVRGEDNGVYTRSTSDGNNWTIWERNGTSLDAAELEVFNNRLYQTVRGEDNGVYTRSTSDGNNWTIWERNGASLDAAELEVFNNRLYQTVRGEDQGVYTRSTSDGNNWTIWERNGASLGTPELEEFNGRLYQTVRGEDQGIYTRSTSDGNNWTIWERNGESLGTPTLTIFKNTLFQHIEGTDGKFYTRFVTNPTEAWTEWREFGEWTFGGGSPLLAVQGAQYFRDRPQFYMQQGNPFARNGLGSTVLGHNSYKKEGNCTWYAYGRLKELGFTPEDILLPPGQQNAKQWGGVRKNGARVLNSNETPQVGDVAQYFGGNYGHVAIVEKVENGRVYLSQSNYLTDNDGDVDGDGIYAGTFHAIVNYSVNNPSRYIRLARH